MDIFLLDALIIKNVISSEKDKQRQENHKPKISSNKESKDSKYFSISLTEKTHSRGSKNNILIILISKSEHEDSLCYLEARKMPFL